jgi:hypothetical protein
VTRHNAIAHFNGRALRKHKGCIGEFSILDDSRQPKTEPDATDLNLSNRTQDHPRQIVRKLDLYVPDVTSGRGDCRTSLSAYGLTGHA